MRELRNGKGRPRKSRRVVRIAAELLGAAVLYQPDLADAAHGGGGHGGFGGLHNGFAGRQEATGTMAGMAGATAGGGPLPDWRGRTMLIRQPNLVLLLRSSRLLSVGNAVQHRLAGGSIQLMPRDLTRLASRQPG